MFKRRLPALNAGVSRLNAELDSSTWTSTTARFLPNWTASTTDVAAPDIQPIQLIHRGEDGQVPLYRKDNTASGTEWVDLGAVSTGELGAKLHSFSGHIGLDTYFSINTTFRPGFGVNTATNLPYSNRKKTNLRFLNAVYADLDCHDKAFNPATVLEAVFQMVQAGILPMPSIVVRSGRGLWLLWLLVDEKDIHQPQRAWPEKIELYNRVERAIQKLLAHLGADPNSVDASRVMRVPGSLNSKAAPGFQKVIFTMLADSLGQPPVYTLPELATIVGAKPKKTALLPARYESKAAKKPISETRSEAARAACRARWQYSLEDFETLRRIRGGFAEGHRTHAVFVYAMLLVRNGVPKPGIREAVTTLANECLPRLPLDKALATMRDALKYKAPVRNITIAVKLGVTEEERRHLTRWFRPARLTRQEKVNQRHNLIRAEVERRNFTPSCSQMTLVLQRTGLQVTKRQVCYDYRTLGLRSQARAGRPKKEPERVGKRLLE
jgi:hypothetical protein